MTEKKMGAPRIHHLKGKRFGRLLVIEEVDPYICVTAGTKSRRWECLCDCGNYTLVVQNYLLSGRTKSCGCLRRKKRGA